MMRKLENRDGDTMYFEPSHVTAITPAREPHLKNGAYSRVWLVGTDEGLMVRGDPTSVYLLLFAPLHQRLP